MSSILVVGVSATDEDGDEVTYTVYSGSATSYFALQMSNATDLQVVSVVDYEDLANNPLSLGKF